MVNKYRKDTYVIKNENGSKYEIHQQLKHIIGIYIK